MLRMRTPESMNRMANDATSPAFDARAGDKPPAESAGHHGEIDGRYNLTRERLEEILAQIEAGTYVDDEKLDVVVDHVLDELKRR